MQAKEFVRRISYTPWVGLFLKRLQLRGIMQRLYSLARGNRGTLSLDLDGVEGIFCTRTPVELRIVEAAWFGEREMLGDVQKALNAGDTFLDAGSNLGIFTIFAAKKVGPHGTVIAFEPETVSHERLQHNIEINRLQNTRVLKAALSDGRAMRRLVLSDPGGVSQSSHLSEVGISSEIVQATDYDSLVANEGFPIPTVVKMDVEGHEYAAIQGMKNALSTPSCAAFFCELHPYALPKGISGEDVVRMIKSLGFDLLNTCERGPQIHITARKTRP